MPSAPLRLCENIPFAAGLSYGQDDMTTQSCKCVAVPSGRLVVRPLPQSPEGATGNGKVVRAFLPAIIGITGRNARATFLSIAAFP